MAISGDCPDCGKEYRVGKKNMGRKFRCRDCGAVVSIKRPRAAQQDDAYDDASWDDSCDYGGYDYAESDASYRRPAQSSKRRRKSKSKRASTPRWVLPVVAGVCAVTVLAGIGIVAWDGISEIVNREPIQFATPDESTAGYTLNVTLTEGAGLTRHHLSERVDYMLVHSDTETRVVMDFTEASVSKPNAPDMQVTYTPGRMRVRQGVMPPEELTTATAPPEVQQELAAMGVPVRRITRKENGDHEAPTVLQEAGKLTGESSLCLFFYPPFALNRDRWSVAREFRSVDNSASATGTLTYRKTGTQQQQVTVDVTGTLDTTGGVTTEEGVTVTSASFSFEGTQTFSLERMQWVSGNLSIKMTGQARKGSKRGRIAADMTLTLEPRDAADLPSLPPSALAGADGGGSTGQPAAYGWLHYRTTFQTKLKTNGPAPQEFDPATPPRGVREVTYQSDDLELKAWYAVPPASGARRVLALVFFHGGFAFGPGDYDTVRLFLDAGFAVMTPMLRGENGNPGDFELFGGEFDDARNAIKWVAQQPEVDASRIYAFGHSAGGGVSAILSLAEKSLPLRHCGSSGGLYPLDVFAGWSDICPFDFNDPHECRMRLLLGNQLDMQRPHFAWLGRQDDLVDVMGPAREEAGPSGKLQVIPVDGDHFSSLDRSLNAYLQLIQAESPAPATAATIAAATPVSPSQPATLPEPEFNFRDVPTRRTSATLNTAAGGIRHLIFAPEPRQQFALSGTSGTFQIWDAKTGRVYRSGRHEAGIECVAFCGDNATFAYGTVDGRLRFYSIASKQHTANIAVSSGNIVQLVCTPGGDTYAAATSRGDLLWGTVPSGRNKSTPATIASFGSQVTQMVWLEKTGGELLIATADGTLRRFNRQTKATTAEWNLDAGRINDLALSRDRQQAVVATARLGAVSVNLADGSLIRRLFSDDEVVSVAVNPISGDCAIGTDTSMVILMKGLTAESISRGYASGEGGAKYLMFSSDGKALAAASPESNQLSVWDLTRSPSDSGDTPSNPFSNLFSQ
jgi:acetyl esterase/lipase/transcription elongation factor Elf1